MRQDWALLVAALLITPTGADRYILLVGKVHNGSYHGIYNEQNSVRSFLGVPFAQPPVANLRLQSPQSLSSAWYYVRNATKYRDAYVGFGDGTDLVADGHVFVYFVHFYSCPQYA